MAVHSAQLGSNGALGTGSVTLYTAPAGVRTIVKSVVLFNAAAANRVYMDFTTSGGSVLSTLSFDLAAVGSPGDSKSEEIWVVLNAGQKIKAAAAVAGARILVSGTELTI